MTFAPMAYASRFVTFEGKILDGRNRYQACVRAKIEPRFEEYTGADPLGYVISLNLKRRHLDESQRSMVAGRIATLKLGANQHASIEAPSQSQAAELLNVSRSGVQRAREVLEDGIPELAAKVDAGEISVSAAADVSSHPKEEQREIVARGGKEILEATKKIREEKAAWQRPESIKLTSRQREQFRRIAGDPKESIGAPIKKPPTDLTKDQRDHIAGAAASLKMVRARLVNNEIFEFTADLDRLIENMATLLDKAAAA